MTVTKYSFKFGGETIVASVHRSKRIRTSEVIVDEDGVIIRTPMNKPMSEIESIVRKKKDWISKKQKEYRKREYQITKPTFESDSTLPYLGKNIPAKVRDISGSNDSIEFIDGEFLLSIDGKATPLKVRKLYEDWLYNRAYNIFLLKVRQYCRLLNVEIKKIRVKDMKGRWGAITKNGGIHLNRNLIKAPEEVIDYMIIHELCHFIMKGHSHHFWELIRSYFPRYKEVIQWLDVNSKAMV